MLLKYSFPLASIYYSLIFHVLSSSLSQSPLLASPCLLNLEVQEGLTLGSFFNTILWVNWMTWVTPPMTKASKYHLYASDG